MQEPIYKLKVAEAKKDKKWYKSVMEYLVPFNNTAVSDYNKMRAAYGLLNNDITIFKEALDKLCKPLGPAFSTPFEIDEEYAIYNRLFPKVMYHVGEMLKRNEGFDVYLNSDALNRQKNQEFERAIEESIDEWIVIQMQMADMMNQGVDPAQLQEYYKQMRSAPEPQSMSLSDFKSELEEFSEKVLDYAKYKFKIRRKTAMSLKHAVVTDRAFVGVVENMGIPEFMVFNPLHVGFHKNPNEERVEKGDYWWYRTAVTYAQAYDELKDKVPQADLDKLPSYTGYSKNRPNEAWDIKSGKARFQPDYSFVEGAKQSMDVFEKHVGQSMGTGTSWRYHTGRLIWKTYIQFKAYREVIFLTYINERNKSVVEVVPDTYEIPTEAVKVNFKNRWGIDSMRYEWVDPFGNPVYAEKQWIPRRYEVTRYGSDIYVDFRECRYQPLNAENPFDFELSLKGGFFTALNSEPISLVERAAPSMMQYILVKNLQNKELAKYEGFIKNVDVRQIPDDIMQDENGEPLFEGVDKLAMWRYYRRKLGDSYYDSEFSGTGLPNYQRTVPVKPEMSGQIMEVLNMQNLLDLIDREMGLQMLVPPQAEGIFAAYSNATDNQQALNQSSTMAEELFSRHSDIWQAAMQEYLAQFIAYYRQFFEDNPDQTETFLNYVNSENAHVTIRITPQLLNLDALGVFVRDTTASESYRRMMLQQVQTLGQNAEATELISSIIMDITRGESPVHIHKKIIVAGKRQEERARQMQEAAAEADMAKQRAELDKLNLQNQHKLEQIELGKDKDLERAALDLYKFTENKNQDQDEIPDYLEALKAIRDMNAKQQEFEFQKRQHADKMALEKKKLAIQAGNKSSNKKN